LNTYENTCPVCSESRNLKKINWGIHTIISCETCRLDYCSQMVEKETGGDSSPVHMEGIEMMANSFHKTNQLAKKYAKKRISIYESILDRKCQNVLELGCGPGVFYKPFVQESVQWDGIDINPHWKKFGEKHNIPISSQPIKSLTKTYDVVMAYQVLEHVENPILLMNGMVSKLKPGGIIHLELPNQNSLTARIRRLSSRISHDYGFIQPPMHLRAYQRCTIQYLFNRFNLESKMVFECGNTDRIWGQVRDYNFLQKLLYTLSGKIGLGSLLVGLAQYKGD